jgi:hypothetical protein
VWGVCVRVSCFVLWYCESVNYPLLLIKRSLRSFLLLHHFPFFTFFNFHPSTLTPHFYTPNPHPPFSILSISISCFLSSLCSRRTSFTCFSQVPFSSYFDSCIFSSLLKPLLNICSCFSYCFYYYLEFWDFFFLMCI